MGFRLTMRHDTPPKATAEAPLAAMRASQGSDSCWNGVVSTCCDAVYVHVPFCRHRCHYCDFFTIAGRDDARTAYVDRLLEEAKLVLPGLQMEAPCVFVGGGTPTYLQPDDLHRLLTGVGACLPVTPVEWTVEANPETVDADIAAALHDGGVTRISVGMQSAQPQLLQALERQHDPESVPRAFGHLRTAGFNDLSVDLIFGIPGQCLAQVQADLEAALELEPTHLSVYGLIYEPGTPLRRRRDSGVVKAVEEDTEADMYLLVQQVLAERGFGQYEISNWALPGRACRHNEVYWLNGNWWPLGPAAAGHAMGTRWRNVPRLKQWMDSTGLPPVVDLECLDTDGRYGEVLMLGLRRLVGVPRDRVEAACATAGRGALREAVISRSIEQGLLQWRDDHLAFTSGGLLLADQVIRNLL